MISLKNFVIKIEIPENENLKTLVNIVEKMLDLNKQQKLKGIPLDLDCVVKVSDSMRIKSLTSKHIVAQVKTGNRFEKLLNKTRQIIYSLYQEKEIIKKA